MDPTVGRKDDLLWVVDATYRRFLRRPTVGLFFAPPVAPSEWGSVRPIFGLEPLLDEGRGGSRINLSSAVLIGEIPMGEVSG